jgi:hypothetical protein
MFHTLSTSLLATMTMHGDDTIGLVFLGFELVHDLLGDVCITTKRRCTPFTKQAH